MSHLIGSACRPFPSWSGMNDIGSSRNDLLGRGLRYKFPYRRYVIKGDGQLNLLLFAQRLSQKY